MKTGKVFIIAALVLSVCACRKDWGEEPEIPVNGFREGNSIVLNPNKQWETSRVPAYIGDISAFPADLQSVIRLRFPRQVTMDAAGIIIVSAAEIAANSEALSEAAANGAFIVVPGAMDFSLLGDVPKVSAPENTDGLGVLLSCYSGWGMGQYYVMYDEPILLQADMGTPSMTVAQFDELESVNKGQEDDGGLTLLDYDNLPDHNENYFQTRMDPFVEWIESVSMERGFVQASGSPSYENMKVDIENSGQRLTYNYSFTLNKYIDQASLSDPDFLCKSGSISVEFRVYPLYMLSSNGQNAGDYYGVVSTVTPHNQSMWGPYAAAHGWTRNRIYGYWFSGMDVETSLVNADGSAIPGLEYFERPIPENQNSSKTYSNGHTVTVSGSFSGGVSGGNKYLVGNFSVGGSWTSSTNYTLETINYTLNSSTSTAKYHYWTENVKLTDDWDDWGLINQNFPAPVRTEFSAHTMWIWHVPSSVVKDYDTQQFKLRNTIRLQYSTWYHWRGSVEYDSNRVDHAISIPTQQWTLDRPNRTPWGFICLRNATDNEMAHVAFYPEGTESGDPITQLTTSFGHGQEARIGLAEGVYNVVWDIVNGNTGEKLGSYIYRDVLVHQGRDEESATVRISSVDGEKRD